MTTETTIEINISALKKNFSFIRSRLPSKTLMLGVVKACGYGSSSIENENDLYEVLEYTTNLKDIIKVK